MKYIVRIIIAILCFAMGLFACIIYKNKLYNHHSNSPTIAEISDKDSLKIKVLQAGDTIAYNKLKEVMQKEGFPHRIWFYSIVMAKQFHYSPASYDVYKCIKYVHNQQLEKRVVDSETKIMISLFISEDSLRK